MSSRDRLVLALALALAFAFAFVASESVEPLSLENIHSSSLMALPLERRPVVLVLASYDLMRIPSPLWLLYLWGDNWKFRGHQIGEDRT